MSVILPVDFYARDTVIVAQELLGKKLIRRIGEKEIVTIIAETEAYRSDEPACHAHRGKTKRNEALFGPVGHTYVYFSYGMHYCVNLVSRDPQRSPAGGVLIRGVIPQKGHHIIDQFRPLAGSSIISGPGNVTKSLAIDLSHIGIDVTQPASSIIIAEGDTIISPDAIISSPRIGISKSTNLMWRFQLRV